MKVRSAKMSGLLTRLVAIGAVLMLTGRVGPTATSGNNPSDDTRTEDVIADTDPFTIKTEDYWRVQSKGPWEITVEDLEYFTRNS